MPEYEYLCQACGDYKFTSRRPMGQAREMEPCPRCGAESKRVFSVPRISQFIAANPRDPEQWR
jgi:putative FmdB family regulatory protein